MVEGESARLPPLERARLVAWQEMRTRAALGDLLSLLAAIATGKVALVLIGIWPAGLPAWMHGIALALLLLARSGYARARRLGSEAVAATGFMLGLITILADPPPGWWIEQPGLTLGWVWLLAVLGIPLLARLGSVVAFCGLLFAAAMLFFVTVPSPLRESLAILLYLLVSIAGGLLFIDLDHFKQRNDLHGHAAGDDALRHVGELLKSRIRDGLAARLGGEEFICLLPGLDANAATLFAHSLREALVQDPDPLTFSGRIAQWRTGEDLTDLLGRGDAAMYRAKQAGRDRVMTAG